MQAKEEFTYFEIPKTFWQVKFNPEGGGLMLCVGRGIPCEGHTQVFSAHATNTPDVEDIHKELECNGEKYATEIDAFCLLMQAMTDWEVKEALGAVFCTSLIRRITKNAENRWNIRN